MKSTGNFPKCQLPFLRNGLHLPYRPTSRALFRPCLAKAAVTWSAFVTSIKKCYLIIQFFPNNSHNLAFSTNFWLQFVGNICCLFNFNITFSQLKKLWTLVDSFFDLRTSTKLVSNLSSDSNKTHVSILGVFFLIISVIEILKKVLEN